MRFLGAICLFLAGCVVDTDPAIVVCEDDAHCPEGWWCPGTEDAPATCEEGSRPSDDDDDTVDDDDSTPGDDDDSAAADDDDATAQPNDDDSVADDDDSNASDDDDSTVAANDDDSAVPPDDDDDLADDDDVADDDDTLPLNDDDTLPLNDDDATPCTDDDGDGACVEEDCDDSDPTVEGTDEDADGFTPCTGDCNEASPAWFPGATDPWGDGMDQSCDGVDGTDWDGDGWPANAAPPELATAEWDCDDFDADANRDDADADGWDTCSGDCDDTEPGRNPAALDVCDLLDNDCDGTVDGLSDVDGDGVTTCGPNGIDGDADDDCDDDNPSAFPGQTAWFPGPRSDGSWDYDCDGNETLRWTIMGGTQTFCFFACPGDWQPMVAVGWCPTAGCGNTGGTPPPCGDNSQFLNVEGPYLNGACGPDPQWCEGAGTGGAWTTQECR